MERFDRLTRGLIERLEFRRASLGEEGRLAARAAGEGLSPHAETVELEAYLAGNLTPEKQARVEEHLEGCLACLDELVELRDLLRGVASPSPLKPGLEARLREAAGLPGRPTSLLARVWGAIRASVQWQVPAGWAMGGAVAIVVLTVAVLNLLERQAQLDGSRSLLTELRAPAPEGTEFTRTLGGPPEVLQGRLGGALRLLPTTGVVGVVGEVREGEVQGASFHTFAVTASDGSRYLFFAWGPPAVQVNYRVKVTGSVREDPSGGRGDLYLGVAESVAVTRNR